MSRARTATIRDVAALAGVSVGTASKALNGRGSLRADTIARVRLAADQLDFRPNPAARSLHAGRTYTVGMITTDTIGRFSIPLLIGAEDTLGAGEMSVLLCDARDDPIRERHHLQVLLSRRVDGIIVTGRRAGTRPPVGAAPGVPVVYAFLASAFGTVGLSTGITGKLPYDAQSVLMVLMFSVQARAPLPSRMFTASRS